MENISPPLHALGSVDVTWYDSVCIFLASSLALSEHLFLLCSSCAQGFMCGSTSSSSSSFVLTFGFLTDEDDECQQLFQSSEPFCLVFKIPYTSIGCLDDEQKSSLWAWKSVGWQREPPWSRPAPSICTVATENLAVCSQVIGAQSKGTVSPNT